MANTDDKNHAHLQASAINNLTKDNRFFAHDYLTYHDIEGVSKDITDKLALNNSATSRGIRSRADLVFTLNEMPDICFSLDLKTNDGPHRNMVLELEPLCRHLVEAECFGDRMMYAYGDYRKDAEDRLGEIKGIWCQDVIPLVTKIRLFSDTPKRGRFIKMVRKFFPDLADSDINHRQAGRNENVNDPYVIVPYEALVNLKKPSVLIEEYVEEEKTKRDRLKKQKED